MSLHNPRKGIASDTTNGFTTRWLREHLFELADLDAESFAAHSTRRAAATALIYLGVDPHIVAALGDGSYYHTFRTFYDRCRALLRVSQALVPSYLSTRESAPEVRLSLH